MLCHSLHSQTTVLIELDRECHGPCLLHPRLVHRTGAACSGSGACATVFWMMFCWLHVAVPIATNAKSRRLPGIASQQVVFVGICEST